jgi:cytochrome P450
MASVATDGEKSGVCPYGGDAEKLIKEGSFTDPAILAEPRAFYWAMRHNDPIHYDESLNSWLVSRHEDIWAIQNDPITFSVNKGYHHQQAQGFQEEFREYLRQHGGGYFPDAIMSDPPYHTRIRNLMMAAFTAHRVKELEPRIEAAIVGIIEELADKGECDAVHDLAVPITIRVICEQLGIDYSLSKKIQRWSQAVVAQIGRMQDRDQMLEHAREICDLQNFLIAEMKDREVTPREDMISDIVHANVKLEDGTEEKLTFAEAVSLIRAILIAGNDTTATALSNMVYMIATRPEVAASLQEAVNDDRLLNRFVEEMMRNEPPVRALSRMSTKEVEVGGVTIPEGAHMLLVYASGNDDESVFPCPRDFDTNRPNMARSVTFGGGPHKCIGISLARMEVKVAAREIAKRLDNIKLAMPVEDVDYVPTVATRMIKTLPITYTRRQG